MIAMTKNTARKYYALHWKEGFEFKYDYDAIRDIEARVASVIAFKKKADRDDYVDRWHNAEAIPATVARILVKYLGVVNNDEEKKYDDMEH